MNFTTLFFDLDDTVYPASTGLWQAIRQRITDFMRERMDLSPGEVSYYQKKYLETYGTTLRGLQIHHQVDTDDFLNYVHDLPLDEYLFPAPQLGKMLASLPQRRWIFTNADRAHARRVLSALEIEPAFDGIIDIRAVDFVSKPNDESFQKAMAIAGETVPARCAFFDDSPRNTSAAGRLGLFTVLIGKNGGSQAADVSIPELKDLREHLPRLWSDPD